MNIPYNEKTFCIDLIMEHYNTENPFTIVEKAREDLDIDVTISDVLTVLGYTEDFEQESHRVSMAEIFNDNGRGSRMP